MSRLNTPSVFALAKNIFRDHRNIPIFHLLYEIMEDLVPSEPLLGETEEDFMPNMFFGLVFDDPSIVCIGSSYAFDDATPEHIDTLEIINALPGIAVSDNAKLQTLSLSTAKIVAALALRSTDGVVSARIYFHPGINKKEAIGYLKVAYDEMIREGIE